MLISHLKSKYLLVIYIIQLSELAEPNRYKIRCSNKNNLDRYKKSSRYLWNVIIHFNIIVKDIIMLDQLLNMADFPFLKNILIEKLCLNFFAFKFLHKIKI